MDYEKEYKSLVAKVKKAHQFAQTDSTKSVLEDILPELRESEDERIRKSLINFLSSFELMRDDATFRKGDFDLDAIKGYISYLEKQKEQKPTPEWMPKFLDELRSKKNYFDWDEHRDLEGHILAIINWIAPDYFKRKEEQKPAEKQDYSGLNDSERAILRGFLCAGVENVPVGIVKETAKDCIAHFPWPTKWNKEDERILKGIIGKIAHDQTYGVSKVEMLSFLKSLRPQPKQEWSEEEEGLISLTIAAVEDFYDKSNPIRSKIINLLKSIRPSWKLSAEDENILNAIELLVVELDSGETINGFSSSDMLRVLKSFRPQPHWKPSEEQISSLKQARDYYMSGDIKYVGRHLSEIAEQLEKLM